MTRGGKKSPRVHLDHKFILNAAQFQRSPQKFDRPPIFGRKLGAFEPLFSEHFVALRQDFALNTISSIKELDTVQFSDPDQPWDSAESTLFSPPRSCCHTNRSDKSLLISWRHQQPWRQHLIGGNNAKETKLDYYCEVQQLWQLLQDFKKQRRTQIRTWVKNEGRLNMMTRP